MYRSDFDKLRAETEATARNMMNEKSEKYSLTGVMTESFESFARKANISPELIVLAFAEKHFNALVLQATPSCLKSYQSPEELESRVIDIINYMHVLIAMYRKKRFSQIVFNSCETMDAITDNPQYPLIPFLDELEKKAQEEQNAMEAEYSAMQSDFAEKQKIREDITSRSLRKVALASGSKLGETRGVAGNLQKNKKK